MAILVTGGTKGIGLSIALAFSKPGAKVFLAYHGDDDAAREAERAVHERGAEPHVIRADVGTPEGAAECLNRVAAVTDTLDQLVHCAVRPLPGPLLDMDLRAFTEAVNLNGTALVYLVQAAKSLLVRGSTVFFLSSRGGRIVVPNYAAIGAGKALAESLVRYLAVELAPRGVRINCVAPGMVPTEAVRTIFGDATDQLVEQSAKSNPSGRAIRDEDYTNLIRFLASPEAEYIQGQVIFVNGGANLSA